MDHPDQRLILYIQDTFARGKSKDQIRDNLILHGWREETVDEVFAKFQLTSSTLQLPHEHKIKSGYLKIMFSLWLKPLIFSILGFIFFGFYAYFYLSKVSLVGISMAVAGTASLCIGMSFALSGLSYYFNYFRRFLGYRRYIGLLGYFLALVYSILLLFVDPNYYYRGFFANIGTVNFILGLFAMAIFTLMAAISNNFSMRKLGGRLSHIILRSGYIAYFLLIIRAINIEGRNWMLWFGTLDSLPPPRLLVSIFAIFVILLRFMLEISLKKQRLIQLTPQKHKEI